MLTVLAEVAEHDTALVPLLSRQAVSTLGWRPDGALMAP